MACKVRLNVVCSSREKRFLVIAYEDWLIEDVKKCIEIVFQKLYPDEQVLKVGKLQNEFHFDLPHHYTVGDTLADAGLLFAIEEEQNPTDRDSTSQSSSQSTPDKNHVKKKKLKRIKKSRNQKKINKRKRTSEHAFVELRQSVPWDNKVTSTTGPANMNLSAEDCKLMPQVVEKVLCEDSEVDVETVEDEEL